MRLVAALACVAGCDAVYDLHRPPIDAEIVDVALDTFDRVACPASYTLRPANLTSAYRVITTFAVAGQHYQECEGDEPGITHLAQLDSEVEAAYLSGQLGDAQVTTGWIGAVQVPGGAALGDRWINTDGSPLLESLWSTNEPNDLDGAENAQEDYARLDTDRLFLIDIAAFISGPGICECDGRSSDPAFVDAYTQ